VPIGLDGNTEVCDPQAVTAGMRTVLGKPEQTMTAKSRLGTPNGLTV
jgi:hypothetical protein